MTDRGDTQPSRDLPPGPAAPARAEPHCRRVPSDLLLQGGKMVEITHKGEVYRLQATRLGKLILTK